MRYGYYLAATDERLGDPKLADQAWYEWTFRSPRKSTKQSPFARYEGASVWVDDQGVEHRRLIMRDIFSDSIVQYPGRAPFAVPKYVVR